MSEQKNMSDKEAESSHQQQILFDESEPLAQKGNYEENSPVIEPQMLFEESNNLPVILVDEESELTIDQQLAIDTKEMAETKLPWLWRIIISLFMMIVSIESILFFIEGFTNSPIITSMYAALFTALSVLGIRALWQEFVGLKQFKKQQDLKKKAVDLLSPDTAINDNITSTDGAIEYCQKLSDSLPCDLVFDNAKEHEEWRKAISTGHSPKELVQLYSRVVLSKVDEKALNDVAKFSTEAVVLVSLSPVAIIDMLIILSRNLRMINKIAGLYGLKLGYWSRVKLIKQVFVNMAYAGASEIISDFGSDMLGAELLGKLSARFAQGLGAGMLTARLGIKTMQLCRPIPFDEKPKLNHVRKKIVKQIKRLVSPSSK